VTGEVGSIRIVERSVLGVREAALDPVELQGRDAQVEQDALHLVDAEVVEGVGDAVVAGVDQPGTVAEGPEALPRDGQRLGVAVEAHHGELGEPLEHGGGVPAHAEGRVDRDGTGARDGRREELERALEEDGGVDLFCHGEPGLDPRP
jgi:hypothetical protein